jgi:tight adherence protein C
MTAGLLIGFFLFILAAVGAAGYVFVLRPSRAEGEDAQIPAPIALDQREMPGAQAAMVSVFRMLGEAIPGPGSRVAGARLQLIAAGYRWPAAVSIFSGIKGATAVLLGVAAAWGAMLHNSEATSVLLAAVCGLGFGYLMPDRVLERLARRRMERLRRALPAALDLLVLGIEAGQALDAAILDTSRGLRVAYPDLASEFTQLHLELKANTSRAEALKNFAERSRDLELAKLAHLLIDTDRFGTSLGPALKTHSRYLRIRFRQLAQEKARKVSVKLIFPVFFLIFPSVILVTLGPAAILLYTQLKNLLPA